MHEELALVDLSIEIAGRRQGREECMGNMGMYNANCEYHLPPLRSLNSTFCPLIYQLPLLPPLISQLQSPLAP